MSHGDANLVWIDLEMTGLDTQRDQIIEIATVVTDSELGVLAEGPVTAIHQPPDVLAAMDDWNQTQHRKSGLLEQVRRSRVGVLDAQQMTLDFVRLYVPPATSPMCGNSVCQDRRFLHRLMPDLERFFHYRHLDVSTVKELARRWAPPLAPFEKDSAHRALDDIRASIEELRYYRRHLFRV
jgi:oligoribonuclease